MKIPHALEKAVFLLACLCLVAAYGAAISVPSIGLVGDDATYIVTGKALAEGRGYRIISEPSEPIQTKYPVLFPALIACVWRVFPEFPGNAVALKSIALCFCALWIFLVYKLIFELLGEKRTARWIALFVAASPLTVFLSTIVLSDIPFAALATASLIFLVRSERTGSGREAMLAALFAALAFHTRTAAIALLAAGVIALMLKGRQTAAILFAAISALLCCPWLAWLLLNRTVPVANSFSSWVPYYQSWNLIFGFNPSEKWAILQDNLLDLVFNPLVIVGIRYSLLSALVCLVATFLIALGLFSDVRRKLNVVHIFVLVYLTMLVLWAFPPFRFLSAVAPFAFLFGFEGLKALTGKRSLTTGLVCVLLLGVLGVGLTQQAKMARKSGVMDVWGINIGPAVWPDFNHAMSKTRELTGEADLIGSSYDTAVYLYTGRHAIGYFPVNPMDIYRPTGNQPDVGSFSRFLHALRIDYIVEFPARLGLSCSGDLMSSMRTRYPAMALRRSIGPDYWLTKVALR